MAPTVMDPEVSRLELAGGLTFLVEEPESDEYDEEQQAALKVQMSYITNYLQQVEEAVYGEGFRNRNGVRVDELMDLKSAAAYWWVQTFSFNDDAFNTTSTYLYKERGGKLYGGPLWDFDRSFWMVDRDFFLNNEKMPWLDHLRAENAEYQQILRETWDRLDAVLQEVTKDGGVLDRYAEEIPILTIRSSSGKRIPFSQREIVA